MSATGMALALFLLLHVVGNLVILIDPIQFNHYAHSLAENPLLLPAEFGLIAILLIHIGIAIQLTRANRAARPIPYAVRQNTGRSRRWWGSSNMGITGTFVLIFIIYHLWHFKFGQVIPTTQGGVEMRDLAATVKGEFSEWPEVTIYIVAMILIMMHLLHGFRSAFETLGIVRSRWDKVFLIFTKGYVIAVMGGFILIPLWIFFKARAG
ncbi:MAG: succinate dehydrogenase cytochrome b subunit [Deltaproteobacteria bacterium]|nr:succinate dehydrogenase cytochrome b subunit [Deltaproteobacteria bacterium]